MSVKIIRPTTSNSTLHYILSNMVTKFERYLAQKFSLSQPMWQ